MNVIVTKVRNGVLAASLLGALGFGASMALASPAEAKARACNPQGCDAKCKAQFGPAFANGFCDPVLGCVCAV